MKIHTLGTPRGSVGPITTFNSRFGTVQRNRVIPLNPQTDAQTQRRATFASITASWRTLTEEQRSAWDAAASADGSGITGFNLYTRINATLALCGMSTVETPPTKPGFGILNLGTLTVESDGDECNVTLAGSTQSNPAPTRYIIWAHPPTSPGRANLSDWRVIKVVSTLAQLNANHGADYKAVFGAPAVGRKVGIEVVQVTDGYQTIGVRKAAIAEGL